MPNGTLTQTYSNVQYKKYNYLYSGTTYNDIHVFTTLTTQGIAPAISTTKVALSTINPATVSSNNVIAKINACMFDYGTSNFYGFFYQGSGYSMYINGVAYTSVPGSSSMYTDPKFWPSFCVKTDGTANIRWFGSSTALSTALPYCRYIIGSCHPLVFNSKCVFNERVYDSESTSKLIYDPQKTITDIRFNEGIGTGSTGSAIRTLLGHKSGGTYVMVCTDSSMNLKTAANMMQDLGCDYAIAMDGGTPSEMRIKDGYGANGKVTAGSGHTLNTAVCAYV